MRRMLTTICPTMALAAPLLGASRAGQSAADFTDWTAVDANVATGTVQGTSVSLAGTNVSPSPASTLDGSSIVFARPEFTPPLPTADAIQIIGATGNAYTLSFATPVTDPVLDFASLASTLHFPGGTVVTRLSGDAEFSVAGATSSAGSTRTGRRRQRQRAPQRHVHVDRVLDDVPRLGRDHPPGRRRTAGGAAATPATTAAGACAARGRARLHARLRRRRDRVLGADRRARRNGVAAAAPRAQRDVEWARRAVGRRAARRRDGALRTAGLRRHDDTATLTVQAPANASNFFDQITITATPLSPAAGATARSLPIQLLVQGRVAARVKGVEVTQAVQTFNQPRFTQYNGVALVKHKKTVVRVFADFTGDVFRLGGKRPQLGMALFGSDAGGRPLRGSPLFPEWAPAPDLDGDQRAGRAERQRAQRLHGVHVRPARRLDAGLAEPAGDRARGGERHARQRGRADRQRAAVRQHGLWRARRSAPSTA